MKIDKGIYWDKPWTLVEQCTKVSEGCLNCWSEAIAKRFGRAWTGDIRIREDRLDIPLKTKKPTVFSIWNDLWHEKVEWQFIRKVCDVMAVADRHIFLILTKRAERLAYFAENLPNVWYGITAENQQRADERTPYLLQIPGKRFLSLEPLLNEIDLTKIIHQKVFTDIEPGIDLPCKVEINSLTGNWYDGWDSGREGQISACMVGCETGPHRRPCKIEWIRLIVQQCKSAGVPVFVKAIQDEKGKVIKDMNLFPEDLRVRELPWER